MYAVVEIQGSQFKVSKDQKLYVNRLKGNEGTKVSFDNELLLIQSKSGDVLFKILPKFETCLLYTSPSPRDRG